jgi:acylphosphatase
MAAADDYARLHLWISGRVQGVFFRGAAADEARMLAITGWARNLADRRVEIIAEGRRSALNALMAWAHDGPSAAHVERVEVEWSESRGEFSDFRVR